MEWRTAYEGVTSLAKITWIFLIANHYFCYYPFYFLQKETVFANVLQFKSQTEHGGMAQCYRTYLDGIIWEQINCLSL